MNKVLINTNISDVYFILARHPLSLRPPQGFAGGVFEIMFIGALQINVIQLFQKWSLKSYNPSITCTFIFKKNTKVMLTAQTLSLLSRNF